MIFTATLFTVNLSSSVSIHKRLHELPFHISASKGRQLLTWWFMLRKLRPAIFKTSFDRGGAASQRHLPAGEKLSPLWDIINMAIMRLLSSLRNDQLLWVWVGVISWAATVSCTLRSQNQLAELHYTILSLRLKPCPSLSSQTEFVSSWHHDSPAILHAAGHQLATASPQASCRCEWQLPGLNLLYW